MPPSGFSPKAVEGAVQFAKTCFEDLLTETRLGKHTDFKSAVLFEQDQMGPHLYLQKDGFVIPGTLQFISACYTDLYTELKANPESAPEAAIEAVTKKIHGQLTALHIDVLGHLVEREPTAAAAAFPRNTPFGLDEPGENSIFSGPPKF